MEIGKERRVSIRVPPSLLKKVEEKGRRLIQGLGVTTTRSAIIRMCIMRYIGQVNGNEVAHQDEYMVTTTIRLDEDVYQLVLAKAKEKGVTVSDIIRACMSLYAGDGQ